METYDTHKFGKCIAWSGDNFVYEYEDDRVIKLSKFDLILGPEAALHAKLSDTKVMQTYFEKHTVDTGLACLPNKERYAFIQTKIEGEQLAIRHLKIPSVRMQLKEIADAYYRSLDDGCSPVDLLGGAGLRSRTLSNIFITTKNQLVLIDYFCMHANRFSWWIRWFLAPMFLLGRKMQEHRLQRFLKEGNHTHHQQ